MRWMFVFLIWLLIGSDITGHNPGLGPGLSVKNAFLYLITMALVFRTALSGNFKLRLPALHMAWATWIGYAILTFFTAWLIIHYHAYDAKQSAIALKSDVIDSAIFCFAVFYGVQSEKDYRTVLNALMAAIGVSSLLTLTDVVGITSLGTKVGESGAEADRVFGAFGHANETGAILALMLPGAIAMVMNARGVARVFWMGLAGATGLVFLLTVSRGAYFGVAVGYTAAIFMFRSVIPPGRIVSWVIGGITTVVLGAVVMAMVNPNGAAALVDRVFGIGSMGMSEASSGRTDIWALAFNEMMEHPVSLITGFGWNVYSTMPTVFAMHNTYLDQWFNLGLLGVATYVLIYWIAIKTARQAVAVSTPPMQGEFIAYCFGMLALAVSVFFGNLYISKPYIFMYLGLTMRGALFVLDAAHASVQVTSTQPRLGVGVSLRRA